LLPDYETSPGAYLSAAFSLPKWLVTDWLGQFGTELTHQICIASNRKPSIYIRPNRLRTTTQELAEKLRQANIDFEIIPHSRSHPAESEPPMKVKSPQAIRELPGFAEGLFTVQDMTSSQAVRILEPQPDWTILDLCAAPGVKTTQLAELTGDAARVLATDISSPRLQELKANTARIGVNRVTIVEYENLKRQAADFGPFDAILLDVPCSNTGVLAKRVEVRHRIQPRAIKRLTKTQSQLLSTAVRLGGTKPASKICYSTCSIQRDENSKRVRDFLLHNPDFELEFEELTLPSAEMADHDGGYVAIIAKK
jgi:16S rRNA (cytosine967-C5)-methyltransferase